MEYDLLMTPRSFVTTRPRRMTHLTSNKATTRPFGIAIWRSRVLRYTVAEKRKRRDLELGIIYIPQREENTQSPVNSYHPAAQHVGFPIDPTQRCSCLPPGDGSQTGTTTPVLFDAAPPFHARSVAAPLQLLVGRNGFSPRSLRLPAARLLQKG